MKMQHCDLFWQIGQFQEWFRMEFVSFPWWTSITNCNFVIFYTFLKKICWTPVLDFSSRLSWVSNPASSPVCNGFLRFTSGVTPAELLKTSLAAEPFLIHILALIYSSIGGTWTRIKCLAQFLQTRYWISHVS